jgi:hypothetical protein
LNFSNLIFIKGFLEFWKNINTNFLHFSPVGKEGRGEDAKLKILAQKYHPKRTIFKL